MLTINSMTAASIYANKLAQKSGLNTPANGGSAVATAQALAEAVEKAKEQAGTVQKNYTQSDNRHTSAAAIANAAESKETDADTKRAQLTQNVSDVIASLRDKLSGADSSASQSSVSAYDKMTALAMQKLQEQQDAARDKAYNAVINNKTLREDEVTISKKAFELAKNAYANAVEGSQNGAAQVTTGTDKAAAETPKAQQTDSTTAKTEQADETQKADEKKQEQANTAAQNTAEQPANTAAGTASGAEAVQNGTMSSKITG